MKGEAMTDLEKVRHSTAHVMAAAVCRLYGNVQLDIGPATEDGFYYDFDLEDRLTPDDFERIEAEMQKIIDEDHPFECITVTRDQASELLAGQTYKLERLAEIPEGEPITFYSCGEFQDLCRGPHVESTGRIRTFKLMNVAGSYFHGIETNPMLQRLYGTAFTNPKQLRLYLKQVEEARKRDHRRLAKDLDLFSISESVGPGLVHWHPKGARIRSIIEDFWRREHFRNGYDIVYTPHVGKANLWETSGHLDFYREGMYAAMDIDGQEYFIKPMNCPFHVEIYKSGLRSYRELPLRWAELGTVYRYEKAGTLHGLFRVRGFTQDDAHIFCTVDQIEEEVKEVIRFCNFIWKTNRRRNRSKRRSRPKGCPMKPMRAAARSTARRSTSRSRMPSAVSGRPAPSSLTSTCRNALTSSISARTGRRTGPTWFTGHSSAASSASSAF
jgi:threonyl-tRNA synthetase